MSERTKRLFLAIPVDSEGISALDASQQVMRTAEAGAHATWVPSPNWHLTIHFLGSVGPAAEEALRQRLQELAGLAGCDQRLDEWFAFPTPKRASVAGIGGKTTHPHLASLWQRTAAIVADLGLPFEKRPLYPHVTLARWKIQAHVPLERLPPAAPLTLRVRSLILYESQLQSTGARYLERARLVLGALP